jgi:hypothetical protein
MESVHACLQHSILTDGENCYKSRCIHSRVGFARTNSDYHHFGRSFTEEGDDF